MSDTQPTLACDLGALGAEERARRAELASRVTARFREVRDLPDGYEARLDPEPSILRDALDWVLLERRCCPFLRFDLCLEAADGPVWLQLHGGPGVKEFLTTSGLKGIGARER